VRTVLAAVAAACLGAGAVLLVLAVAPDAAQRFRERHRGGAIAAALLAGYVFAWLQQ
jgi:hypothetical protein